MNWLAVECLSRCTKSNWVEAETFRVTEAPTSNMTMKSNDHKRWTLNDLSGQEWVQLTKSFLFQRGLGANHPETKYEKLHPGTFSYQDAQRLIHFFTKKGQRVLDPMMGVASTLKASALTGRFGTGIDLNPQYCQWGKQRLQEEVPSAKLKRYPQVIIEGDARMECSKLPDDHFHFVLTSPPYWKILQKEPDRKASDSPALSGGTLAYSDDLRDFGCIDDYDDFLHQYSGLVLSWRRLVQPRRYIALIVSDFRHGERLFPFHADLNESVRERHPEDGRQLVLQGISVLAQNQKRLLAYGYPTTYVPNIHHQYILIYRNMED